MWPPRIADIDVYYRRATGRDAEAIARLHADSWRRNYRGAYPDDYLDGDLVGERLSVWTGRLADQPPTERTVVAERRSAEPGNLALFGFVHTILGEDQTWGALLDNLHVTHAQKGLGIGTRLMAESAGFVVAEAPGQPLFLWVLEQNTAAQAFYQARGGTRVERMSRHPRPGFGLRYAWADPSALIGS